ncbi:hypothetical protein Ddye_001608 [Dipteronia dyeriana]|uniref:Uncharacterized protein n=1 Tax=Dipteronia dyeriana TaxID=168575 RepID=A0AAD9XNZ3_9ROSI|nr:hypothetical protein Ddye_001608 [Dipteronia dyeriana]
MSIIDNMSIIDAILINLAINDPKSLESLKEHHVSMIERINESLRIKYQVFDKVYLNTNHRCPHFEKDLHDLEEMKTRSENKIEEIERLLNEYSHQNKGTSEASTSSLNEPE